MHGRQGKEDNYYTWCPEFIESPWNSGKPLQGKREEGDSPVCALLGISIHRKVRSGNFFDFGLYDEGFFPEGWPSQTSKVSGNFGPNRRF